MRKYKSYINALVLLTCFILTVTGCSIKENNESKVQNKSISGGLTVSYIDVGQGDSILLRCKNDSMLIDAGENDRGEIVSQYLKDHSANRLKYAVGTHPHSDHIGGMDTVINNIKTDTFICPDTSYGTETWKDVLSACRYNNTKIEYGYSGKSYSLGDASFTILSPGKKEIYSQCNNFSIVIKLDYGETSFLFTGDAESLVEEEMLKRDCDLHADVLKVAHHGSSSGTGRKFLEAVDPSVAVISCGENNSYGHPHRETLSALNDRGVDVYRTDLDGTVIISSDGEKLSAETENYDYENTTFYTGKETEITEETTGKKEQSAFVKNNSNESYIGNKNSRKFHTVHCSAIKVMSSDNKVYFKNRQEAVSQGYTPCQSCNP